MSLATVILVLQMAISLLANPNLSNDATAKAQAFDFANQAIVFANQALALPATTTLEDVVSTSTPPMTPEIATSTVDVSTSTDGGISDETGAAVAPVTDTNVPVDAATTSENAPPIPRHIAVGFSNNSNGDGFVTVTDDAGVAVRIKNLDVASGTLVGMTFGSTYGEGLVYSRSFADGAGNSFDRFACNGLGSLGEAVEYGGNVDPCARKNSNEAINELEPGEAMVLRYVGGPTGVTYEPGSIVEVGTGNDVTF